METDETEGGKKLENRVRDQRSGGANNWERGQRGQCWSNKCSERHSRSWRQTLGGGGWGVSVSWGSPKGAQGDLVLTYLHPRTQSSSQVPPPHGGPPIALPELEATPQGAESSGSKRSGARALEGVPGHAFSVPKASVQGLCCVSAQICGHGVCRP